MHIICAKRVRIQPIFLHLIKSRCNNISYDDVCVARQDDTNKTNTQVFIEHLCISNTKTLITHYLVITIRPVQIRLYVMFEYNIPTVIDRMQTSNTHLFAQRIWLCDDCSWDQYPTAIE